MTDTEFEVLDELYFVQSFAELQQETALDAAVLEKVLDKMCRKGWVSFMLSRSGEQQEGQNFPADYRQYYFLASKAGLLAHNRR